MNESSPPEERHIAAETKLDFGYFVHDHKTYVRDSDLRKHSQAAEAWQLRDDFLSLKADSKSTLAFLNKRGRWIPFRNYVDIPEIILFLR